MNGVALVQFSNLDLGKFLTLGRQAFQRNLAEAADSAGFEPPLNHMLCVAAMKDAGLRPSAAAVIPYLNMFHAGFVIAADDMDFAEILELAGMPAVLVGTQARNIKMALIAGNLLQWKAAVLRGCQKDVTREVRHVYNGVFAEFKRLGLTAIFEAKQTREQDGMFYLEYSK
jgi:hypothetical protein